jgi:nucleoside 2-deoxyribosyltransferase
MSIKVYFAGGLFSYKDLLGNAALASAIDNNSLFNYTCILPQALEQRDTSPKAIRNQDITTLMSCDVALFNFDGTELDSGTVVEFMIAKMLDIPSIILRSDFRNGGDQKSDPWNLMVSNYPRTTSIMVDPIAEILKKQESVYSGCRSTGSNHVTFITMALSELADRIIKEFERLIKVKQILTPVFSLYVSAYMNVIELCGVDPVVDREIIRDLVMDKIKNGVLEKPENHGYYKN